MTKKKRVSEHEQNTAVIHRISTANTARKETCIKTNMNKYQSHYRKQAFTVTNVYKY